MRKATIFGLAVWVLMTTAALAQDAYEPDDVYTSATTLVPGVPQHNHSIDPATDIDWVTFTLAQGTTISLQTDGVSGDTAMFLYESDGTTLIESDYNDGEEYFSWIGRYLDAGV